MAGPERRRRSPEGEAGALRRQFGREGIPVPVEDLAHDLDVELHYRPFEGDISGMLFRDGTRKVLGVNSAHAYTRQRFTIAHELGHLLLHEGRAITVDKAARVNVRVNLRNGKSSLATDREEIDANQFAAALLMPEDAVQKETSRTRQSAMVSDVTEAVARLATAFDVSPSAMQYRLINLGVLAPE